MPSGLNDPIAQVQEACPTQARSREHALRCPLARIEPAAHLDAVMRRQTARRRPRAGIKHQALTVMDFMQRQPV